MYKEFNNKNSLYTALLPSITPFLLSTNSLFTQSWDFNQKQMIKVTMWLSHINSHYSQINNLWHL